MTKQIMNRKNEFTRNQSSEMISGKSENCVLAGHLFQLQTYPNYRQKRGITLKDWLATERFLDEEYLQITHGSQFAV